MGRYNAPRLATGAVMGRTRPEQADPAGLVRHEASEPGAPRLADILVPERNSFGVVRLVLALAVLISHAVWLTTGRHELEPLHAWTGYTLGQHAVQVFFVLSGILVAQSLSRSASIIDYAAARALRVFPGLAVCVIVTALLLGPIVTQNSIGAYLADPGVGAYIVKTISLSTGSATLPGVFTELPASGAVNTSLWTLKYEVLCYGLLALAGMIAIATRAWKVVTVGGLVVWALVVLSSPVGLEVGTASSGLDTLRYFMLFFGIGVLAFALRRHIVIHGAMVLALGFLFTAAIGTRFEEAVAGLFLGYAALWVATFRLGRLRAYANANDYSYGTYIYSMPITQALILTIPDISIVPLVLLATAVTLVVAFVSWEFVERPALARRHALAEGLRRLVSAAGVWASSRRPAA